MSEKEIDATHRIPGTSEADYTESLLSRQSVWWKKLLDVQAPYRWHIRSLKPGYVLDVGCGIGRNLEHLNGEGIGVDHNQSSITLCREKGLQTYTVEDFKGASYPYNSFDSILLAHVAEHMSSEDFLSLIEEYHPYLREGGNFIVITPQEAGYKSDPTHVTFVNHETVAAALQKFGYHISKSYSFPFPRSIGKIFRYNEFVTIGKKKV